MRVKPLQIHWHATLPVYSADFEPFSKGRLATAGGDSNVRMWKVVKYEKESPRIEFLSTLNRHTAPVNVVRFSPRGGVLASAGDDGNVILWIPAGQKNPKHSLIGNSDGDSDDEIESWRAKTMLRGALSDIYDLAWSPDAMHLITGSIDNTARIWNTHSATCLYILADHSHYVQGVAWDPLGEYIATQSSDRSVHLYSYGVQSDGSLNILDMGKNMNFKRESPKVVGFSDPDTLHNPEKDTQELITGTSTKINPSSLDINSEDSPNREDIQKNGSENSKISIPLKVMACPNNEFIFPSSPIQPKFAPTQTSSAISTALKISPSKPFTKSFRMYCDENLNSFFRRLTFTPDGALLLTPAGQYRALAENIKIESEARNTVYLYSRNKLNKLPIACLRGYQKPSICVKCSPVLYELRSFQEESRDFDIDNSLSDTSINGTSKNNETDLRTFESKLFGLSTTRLLDLPYRMIYAVATQDAIIIYDTQQLSPLVTISNLHYATFTDLTWSADGNTLIATSSDGFCSIVCFHKGELGELHSKTFPTSDIKDDSLENASLTLDLKNSIPLNTPSASTVPQPNQKTATLNLSTVGFDKEKVVPSAPTVPQNVKDLQQQTESSHQNKKRRIAPIFVESLDTK
ncbi:hypothetical protein G9A89_011199 [Geosiphon pyriformis]|nr:hypothetical protein G9A89_011199 [Geosiphon pyriformis]